MYLVVTFNVDKIYLEEDLKLMYTVVNRRREIGTGADKPKVTRTSGSRKEVSHSPHRQSCTNF